FINETRAMALMDPGTALVVVDVNKAAMTESAKLIEMSQTTVILDHHRQSGDSIDNAVLSYVDPYASSACEMVTDVLRYLDNDVKLQKEEADAMYAGLMIDTTNFTSRTGVNTFEAAAFLKQNGADVARVRSLLSDDMATYKARARAISSAEMFEGCYAFAICDGTGMESPTVIGAQAANDLLDVAGVKASFVFTELKGVIYISARSMGEVNVQLVMEKFGGGGHSTMAGAQLKDRDIPAAVKEVQKTLRTMKEEGEI
ncbi:MAG: DHH family phosphoesterase, partial [Lachnospiraceae bacterium]|nr:DHH family phosphoesterase [Lachnospiraceae bacterium]